MGRLQKFEKADEIPEEFFSLQKVGLTAGASTPDNVIDEVVDFISIILYNGSEELKKF
ncbi:hypothetical protein IWA51_10100 [Treponema peruense]|uniref:4-hydroxy-3-methylbut-2-enyl diphosphate reductase n=1 Tax=Treponema peruense TaxID=2787628 RepID=A0A7T3RCK2_9SPIR|nr:hypothetical protein IWA51_10100 [Treponema peruense]